MGSRPNLDLKHPWQDLGIGLIMAGWILANYPTIRWLWQSLERGSRFQLVFVGILIGAIAYGWVRLQAPDRLKLPLLQPLQLRFTPILLMLGSSMLAIGNHWFLDVHQLTAILFGIGTYGVMGLVLHPALWQRGLPIALLVSVLLPFSSEFGTGLGFPARVLTAQSVEQLLSFWHVTAISSHDIILLENGVAHVDIPCSGLKSLWTGTLFLLVVTWLERRQLGWRWLLVWVLSLGCLVSVNVSRVLILVVLAYVLKQPQFADILHVPLGILGFVVACGTAWWALQSVPQTAPLLTHTQAKSSPNPQHVFLLLVTIVLLGVLPQLSGLPQQNVGIAPLVWPSAIKTEPLPLTPAEKGLFESRSALLTEKLRFMAAPNLTGSILVVGGQSWSTFHAPELCFAANGLSVNQMEPRRIEPNLPVRWLSLQNGQFSAIYWFQSPHTTTDNFLSRLKNQTLNHDRLWVMVSILFDQAYAPDDPKIQAFARTIQHSINIALQGDQP